MVQIRITLGEIVVTAGLSDTDTARLVADALPIESKAQRWGRELYFAIPVQSDEEDAQAEVASGTVAYWPPGRALCLFFGQQPYSPVNVVGSLERDPEVLGAVQAGTPVRVEKI
jgi:hypothetical protein